MVLNRAGEADGGFGFRVRNGFATLARLNVAFGPEEWGIEYKVGRDF